MAARLKSSRTQRERQKKPHPAKILVVYTGGTFGMAAHPKREGEYYVPELSEKELRDQLFVRVEEIGEFAPIQFRRAMNMDSSEMRPENWAQLVSLILQEVHCGEPLAGVVILHGTDTLAYTAAALHYALSSVLARFKIPVILTGAMRPLAMVRTDARRNLLSALELLRVHAPPSGVYVFFDQSLLWGVRTRKRSAFDLDAFWAPRGGLVAQLGSQCAQDRFWSVLQASQASRLARGSAMSDWAKLDWKEAQEVSAHVPVLHITPGFRLELLEQLIAAGARGVVIILYGSGTSPGISDVSSQSRLRACMKKIPIILCTEGEGAQAKPRGYASGRAWLDAGAVFAGDMTPEAAWVKLIGSIVIANGPLSRAKALFREIVQHDRSE